jgi:NAD(P)-dependent dehydrogenase (short-subunit alcohol dehydrogenase family)
VLEQLATEPLRVAALPTDLRKRLLEAANRFTHPDRTIKRRAQREEKRTQRALRAERDRAAKAQTGIRALRAETVFSAPLLPSGQGAGEPARVLEKPRACYVCKAEYRTLHPFYDAMCTACGDFNYAKRFQSAPLDGKVALVTGARVKIGFQASLMLLRAGAQVIATTRFPHDAALRYCSEPDFAEWRHRLQVHGLDLRHAPSVELLARHLAQRLKRLDILLNNAAQTVRRPPGFYSHLQQLELSAPDVLSPDARGLLRGHHALLSELSGHRTLGTGSAGGLERVTWRSADAALGLHASAALSQLPYAMEQDTHAEHLFPAGRLDADLQQVDLRTVNSWRLSLAEVTTSEMMEVYLVNAVAPFILCGKLKPLMLRDRRTPGHIVNVSAMEGSFSRHTKTDKHPHTNMAKAALNMMTLTSAPDYAKSNIFMNAVDTGWVTDEDPAVHAERKVQELDFQPPLDIVDGAARIVDPIFHSERTGEYASGIFYKDYKPTQW